MISSRFAPSFEPSPWSAHVDARLLAAHAAGGAPVIDLTVSNVTAPEHKLFSESLEESLEMADSDSIYQPHPRGAQRVRALVADHLAQALGPRPNPNDLWLTASTSEAYVWLFALLADCGDEILVPEPSYPLFASFAAITGVRLQTYALVYDDAWMIDLQSLVNSLSDRTRAIVVVSPNNPTGSRLRRWELDAITALCAQRAIALIADEVFAEYLLDPAPDAVDTVVGERRCLTFALGGLSKSAGFPQAKLGWIAMSGPDNEVAAASRALDHIADSLLSVSGAVQRQAPWLMQEGRKRQALIDRRIRDNLTTLRSLCDSHPAAVSQPLRCEGGWAAVLRVPAICDDEQWARWILDESSVLVQPGHLYDFSAPGHLVLSLLTEPQRWAEGVRKMLGVIAQHIRQDASRT
ncbi:MAG: pyridoxal phosphate-dependent aminotransferase [Deltaproteobacteria bacterium]|nr:pyridoxal phosphate-dependent aminotransferase [Deltaproteobacteria bacterium]